MNKKIRYKLKKAVASTLASTWAVGVLFCISPIDAMASTGGGSKSTQKEVTFNAAPIGHVYVGMPLFDGEPTHYEAYLDALIDYMGLEGAARFAFDTRGDYVLKEGENAGRTIPGSLNFTDCVQGVSTDFPAIIGLGQSWNKELVESVGKVLGNERINKVDYSDLSNINVMACTATSDLRINPLSGRFDEGFAEDPYLTGIMVNEMATGVSGINEVDNEDGFWQKAVVTTKHFTTYNAQSFRSVASNIASIRALMEYQSQGVLKGISTGAVGGFMTSYGRTNGVPNIISPLINYAKSLSPYGLFSVTDAGSVRYQEGYSNGYDTSYVPVIDDSQYNGQGYSGIGAIMALANSAGASTTSKGDESFKTLIEQVKAGTYGITEQDVYNVARDQIGQLVRCGVLNENMEDYPFYRQSLGQGSVNDYTLTENQEIALKAAEESIVLLKNDNNLLPLKTQDSVYVSGPMSTSRFKTTYAVGDSPMMENTLYSSVAGIQSIGKAVSASTDGEIVRIKTSLGKYIALDSTKDDGTLTLVDSQDQAATFEKYSWGQDGYSYWCRDNEKWLETETVGATWFDSGTIVAVKASGEESLEQRNNDLDGTYITSKLPYRIRVEKNKDGTLTYVLDTYSESFVGIGPVVGYYEKGSYISADETLGFTDPLENANNANKMRTQGTRFTEEVVKAAGEDTINSQSEYAVVVVGAPTRHSSGEGCDRSDMYLGADQYKLIENVAKAYPKKTIVVIQTNYPVIVEDIKNNENVAAILTQPYAGEYGGYALGKMIYGETTPTGRLTSTWYKNNEVLPKIDSYSIPEGQSYTLDQLDPRFKTDMTNADPIETKLTYMYSNDEDITYEFGAGLTYSNFEYSNIQVPSHIKADGGSFEVKVDVTNMGNVGTAEVVQIYMRNKDTVYGQYAPSKKLVAFEKVYIEPNTTKTVTLAINSEDLVIWDVNRHMQVVESGIYEIMVGKSSTNIVESIDVKVEGEQIGILNATAEAINVFDSAFANNDVIYKEVSKAHTAQALAHASRLDSDEAMKNVSSGYYAVMSKDKGSWVAMKNVNLDKANKMIANVATTNKEAIIEVRLDGIDGTKVAEIKFNKTPVINYTATEEGEDPQAASDIEINELGFVDITTDLEKVLSGIHDVYIVFKTPNTRINTIKFQD